MAVAETEAQTEFLYDVVPQATLTEVLHADCPAVDVVLQNVVEIICRPLVDYEHSLTVRLLFLLLLRQFALLYLYVIPSGKPAQGIRIGQLLVLHEEAHAIAPFSAHEAMARATGWRNIERRRVVVVERTQATIVHAHFLQRHEL